ncbi:MAG: glycosyltransferase [Bacteroidia bacterium]|nr:glycosyltransferase [Bacteroidia bacterium]
MKQPHHIVHLPRAYPSKLAPISSIFFKEQVAAISQYDNNIKLGVIAIIQKPILKKIFFKNSHLLFSTNKNVNRNIITWIKYLFTIPLPYRIKRQYVNYRLFLLFRKYVSSYGKPNLIHLQTYEMGAVALKIFKKYGIPYIVTEHSSNLYDDKTRLSHDFLKKIYLNSRFNIAVSPFFSDYLTSKFTIPFTTIPNIVDINKFTLKPENKSPKINLLHVAHCVEIKQQKLLILGFTEALKINKLLNLTIVGDGPELESLRALVKELKVEDRINFTGSLDNEAVKTQMHHADIFILTSKKETFGVVLIEALAVGLPCISTSSGGPEGIITNEGLGLICDHNPEDLARAIIAVTKKRYDPVKIRQHVVSTYSAAVVANKITNVYNDVLSR